MGFWIEMIKTIACQFGTSLTDDDVKNMPLKNKVEWIKRNRVTAARLIDN